MHKAPSIQRPREIRDSSGRTIGWAQGFQPDPGTGGLGIELQLTPAIREQLGAPVDRLWVRDENVMAVRRDSITLDLSLPELARMASVRAMEQAAPELGREPADPTSA